MKHFLFFFGGSLVSLFSCNSSNNVSAPHRVFIDRTAMDSSVKPGDNFYLYVNGGWLRKTEIPPTESELGSFLDLYNRTKGRLHFILDSLTKSSQPAGSIEQKVADFFGSGMDSALIDKRGPEPLKPYLMQIDAMKNPSDIMRFVASHRKMNA